jgi:hypothetical protein
LQPDFLHDVSPDDKSLFIVCIAVACSYCRPAPVLCAGGSQYSVNLLVMAEIISSKCFTCAGGRLKTHWAGNDCCQDALWSVHISSRGNILAQNAPAALKMLARCSTLLCFSPCSHAFALKILLVDEL